MDDKEKLLRAYGMMCKNACDTGGCEIAKMAVGYDCTECQTWIAAHPKETVRAIEKWEAENPVKTRQDLFLEQYPNAKMGGGNVLDINPCSIESALRCYQNGICIRAKDSISCTGCKRDYWSQVITE